MRFAVADGAEPALPNSEWKNGKKEKMQDIEAPKLNRAALPAASQAVIIAKRDFLGRKAVDAVDDQHTFVVLQTQYILLRFHRPNKKPPSLQPGI